MQRIYKKCTQIFLRQHATAGALVFVLLLMHLFLNAGLAQTTTDNSVYPELVDGKLFASCRILNLLDDERQDILASGMSSKLQLEIHLEQMNVKSIIETQKTISFRYNVWEKNYLLYNNGLGKTFSKYSAFNAYLSDSLTFQLLPENQIPKNSNLQIIVYLLSGNLSKNQKKKLDYWINNQSANEESEAAGESESGFSINLSTLISAFISDESESKIMEIRSAPFSLESLRKYENRSQ